MLHSQVLVKGQPNVSYICSRYYRAPELMFGAVEYTVSVDVWSVGTILMELLLGHLPFQGQDSTQQHLVEVMKLLGTPSEGDLHAMRASFSVDDLPKLVAYPWDKCFPTHTAADAIDLAQRLLRYDPDQRLTASQVANFRAPAYPACGPTTPPTQCRPRGHRHSRTLSSMAFTSSWTAAGPAPALPMTMARPPPGHLPSSRRFLPRSGNRR